MIEKTCQHCGAKTDGNFSFCPFCGTELGKTAGKLDDQLIILLRQNKLFDAIKLVRERMGLGLKESKDYVENLAKKNNIMVKQAAGSIYAAAIGFLVFTFVLGMAIFILLSGN